MTNSAFCSKVGWKQILYSNGRRPVAVSQYGDGGEKVFQFELKKKNSPTFLLDFKMCTAGVVGGHHNQRLWSEMTAFRG